MQRFDLRAGSSFSSYGLILVTMVASTGCHTMDFRETYYVGVSDRGPHSVQFYRFDVHGRSGWTNTKYATGWFSADALAKLVGDGLDTAVKDAIGTSRKSESTKYIVTGPEGTMRGTDDQRLAIIMHSDPEPITKALQAFAKSSALTDLVKTLAERRKKKSEEKKKTLLDRLKESLDGVKKICDGIVDNTKKNECVANLNEAEKALKLLSPFTGDGV